MPLSLGNRIDQGARQVLPAATTLLFIVMGVAAWPLPYIGPLAPSFGLMGIYYWSIHRPDLFGPFLVFLFGLLQDALQGFPLGLSAFLFVATYQIVLSQRRYFSGQVFPMLWFGFALVMLLNFLAAWVLFWIVTGVRVAFLPPLFQAAFSIIVFPLPAWALIRLQRAFLSAR
jgi:rod shape-determining protein MreD